jgi:PhnB protein
MKKKTAAKKATRKPKKVNYLPKGYQNVIPCFTVQNAKSAIEFYVKVFGAKVVMKMDKPDGKIGHAELKIGDGKVMLADECPEIGARGPKAYGGCAMGIHLYVKKVDDVVKKAKKLGAKVKRPVMDMFYGDRSGTIEDPYGHIWHISTHIEDLTQAQMRKRASEFNKRK